ncbi:hypothetical protein WA588_000488 [Blastocystis sp. NMH]
MTRSEAAKLKVQIVRISVIAAVVFIGVLCGYLLSWILFKPIASGVARSQATYGDAPTNYDGVYFDSERSISIVPSIDGPYLSIFLWFQVGPSAGDDTIVLLSNRDVGCGEGRKSIGYSIFYEVPKRSLVIQWRTKKSKCEQEVLPDAIRIGAWTHIAVVFRPMEEGLDDDAFAELVYPMIMDVYVNGQLVATRSSIRFIADDRQTLAIGGTPRGENPFQGRIYQLMIAERVYDQKTVFSVYQRHRQTMEMVKQSAAVTFGFNS